MQIADAEKKRIKKGSTSKTFKVAIGGILTLVGVVSIAGFMFYNADQANKRQELASRSAEVSQAVDRDVIYDNIYVNDVNIGGLTEDDAVKKLESLIGVPTATKKITVLKGSEEYPFTFQELGSQYTLKEAAEIAWNYARDGSDEERYEKIKQLAEEPYKITAEHSFNERIVREKVSGLAEKLYIEPVSASMTRSNGAFQITEGKTGERLDVEATTEKILQKLKDNEEGSVEAVITEEKPKYTRADLEQAQSLLGTYSTSFSAGENGRNTNMRTAVSKINDTVLYPGEVFSTNAAFGAMTYDNGYRPAPVIVNGKLEDDFGGGVCQVSSTLYNTLLYSELEIVERQNHSLKVGYLPYGYDATLAGDYIDLKFKNDTDAPIYIEALVPGGNKILVNIYGHETRSPGRKLEFQNALVETISPPAEAVTNDPSLPQGQRVVDDAAKTGYKYNVYKIVYENGKEVSRVLVNTSTYRAVRAQVRVGTGAPSVAAAEPQAAPVPADSNPPVIDNQPQVVESQPPVVANPPAAESQPPAAVNPPPAESQPTAAPPAVENQPVAEETPAETEEGV